jgi:hypothetical protein
MRGLWGLALLLPSLVWAQEDYRVDLMVSGWLVDTSGTVRSGLAPIDLRSDLGVGQRQPTFTGRLDLKPGRRWHVLVEGTPYRLRGDNTLTRTITFQGQQYTFEETIHSTAEVNYVFGGVEYDLVHRDQGHLGFFAGGAYVDATATLHGVTTGVTATESEQIGLPLPGLDFRAFPVPGSRRVIVDGNVQGMSFGGYGRFVNLGANAGVFLMRAVAIEAGYMLVDADLHSQGGARGVAPRFSGPVFSLRLER